MEGRLHLLRLLVIASEEEGLGQKHPGHGDHSEKKQENLHQEKGW